METHDLLQCVDRGLNSFGSNLRRATYWALVTGEGVSSDRILSNPGAFVRALKEVFGPGYPLAERAIVKEIKSVFELFSTSRSYSLVDALENARTKITDVSNSIKNHGEIHVCFGNHNSLPLSPAERI